MTDDKKLEVRGPDGRFVESSSGAAASAREGKAIKRRERQELAAKAARNALAQIADEKGLDAAHRFAQSHDDDVYLDAWRAIVLQQARLAVDADKRGSTGAARFVGTAAELMPDTRPLERDTQLPAMQLNISSDALLALAERLEALPSGDAITVETESKAVDAS